MDPQFASPLTLTRRQEQVVRLLALGYTVAEIGAVLGITPRTARAHVDALRMKLGVGRQRHICRAYREMFGRDPSSLAA